MIRQAGGRVSATPNTTRSLCNLKQTKLQNLESNRDERLIGDCQHCPAVNRYKKEAADEETVIENERKTSGLEQVVIIRFESATAGDDRPAKCLHRQSNRSSVAPLSRNINFDE